MSKAKEYWSLFGEVRIGSTTPDENRVELETLAISENEMFTSSYHETDDEHVPFGQIIVKGPPLWASNELFIDGILILLEFCGIGGTCPSEVILAYNSFIFVPSSLPKATLIELPTQAALRTAKPQVGRKQ